MKPGLPVSSIPQCKYNSHQGACLELFQAIGCFESPFIEVQQALKMICKVRLLKSQIQTRSFLEDIITSSNEVFKGLESDTAEGIRQLVNPTRTTAESNDIPKQTAGFQILTLLLEVKISYL